MNILDYTDRDISADEFFTLINNARKQDKNSWYGFVGNVDGRKVMVKGYRTWLQRYSVDGLYQPSSMDISAKRFLTELKRPFTK